MNYMNIKSQNGYVLVQKYEWRGLLSKSARGKHFGDEVKCSPLMINPMSVELHNWGMIEVLEEVNFRV